MSDPPLVLLAALELPKSCLRGKTGNHLLADLLASLAGGPADTAMLVHLRMLLAFLAADTAGDDTGLKLSPQKLGDRIGLAPEDARGGLAYVGAVEVEPNALGQHLHLLFSQAGIGAKGAGVGALHAGIDAGSDYGQFHERFSRMRAEHFLCFHCCSPVVLGVG